MDSGQWTMNNGQWTMDNGQLRNDMSFLHYLRACE